MTKSDPVIQLEETPERLKISIPDRLNWPLLLIYTVAMAAWVAMIFIVIIYLLLGQSTSLILTILLILWLRVWFLMGRLLWNRLQYQAANREVIFIDSEQLILRRPVSFLGITTAYDIDHVSPFYFSDKHKCPAFDYAYMHVYFGSSLSVVESEHLVEQLNDRLFPDLEDEE